MNLGGNRPWVPLKYKLRNSYGTLLLSSSELTNVNRNIA